MFLKSEQTESLDSHKLRGALDTNVDDSVVTMEKKEIEALRNRVKELEILQLTADSEVPIHMYCKLLVCTIRTEVPIAL